MVASVKVMVMVMVKVMVMVMVMVMVVLPDGGHGLDAEEQSRGKVVHAGDTLGMIINPEKNIKKMEVDVKPGICQTLRFH